MRWRRIKIINQNSLDSLCAALSYAMGIEPPECAAAPNTYLCEYINEANYGQSKADFVSKMHIALKETAETEYWLKLLTMSEYITEDMGKSLLNDCLEIKRILVASINTAKENQ